MFGNKRLAKRSIVGTRVSAMWPQDGRYYPGIILAQVSEETITTNAVYVIKFDDGFTEQIKSRYIVGPGFHSVTSAVLKHGQKVYLTWNGREVGGTVLRHNREFDEVTAIVKMPTGEEFETAVKLEDIRLLESRKSARLVDQQDTDYSKLADLQVVESNRRKLISSHVIDVPSIDDKSKSNNYRRYRPSPDDPHDGDTSGNFDDLEMMDEMIAATVLTSLSVSPTSPKTMSRFPTYSSKDQIPENNFPYPDSHLSSSVASSGFYSGHSERDDSSPPLPPLSESAPANIEFKPPTPGSEDSSDGSGGPHYHQSGASIVYQCTWRGCNEKSMTNDAIERHIRRAHFDRDSDIELTDDEEEFHYIEIDVTANSINTMTKSFAAMNTSSSSIDENRHKGRHRHLSSDNAGYISGSSALSIGGSFGTSGNGDHDYQRKMSKQVLASSVPINGQNFHQPPTSSLPISISEGQIKRTLSWHSQSSPQSSLSFQSLRTPKLTPQERLYQHQAQSPKSSVAPPMLKVTQHRRPRSEVRKCRKVYGMDHREQWCTQCKWKKACTRFVD